MKTRKKVISDPKKAILWFTLTGPINCKVLNFCKKILFVEKTISQCFIYREDNQPVHIPDFGKTLVLVLKKTSLLREDNFTISPRTQVTHTVCRATPYSTGMTEPGFVWSTPPPDFQTFLRPWYILYRSYQLMHIAHVKRNITLPSLNYIYSEKATKIWQDLKTLRIYELYPHDF